MFNTVSVCVFVCGWVWIRATGPTHLKKLETVNWNDDTGIKGRRKRSRGADQCRLSFGNTTVHWKVNAIRTIGQCLAKITRLISVAPAWTHSCRWRQKVTDATSVTFPTEVISFLPLRRSVFYAFLFPTGARGYSALAFAASLSPIHVTAISPPLRASGRLAVKHICCCSLPAAAESSRQHIKRTLKYRAAPAAIFPLLWQQFSQDAAEVNVFSVFTVHKEAAPFVSGWYTSLCHAGKLKQG